ncbi:glycosyltransferase family 2 protein [Prevotella sp.]|jgi:glycosyltransferase involved in cell wall biosynthesis|uniref:glycosyltransferase family 2 protein n=1 Tax=Prevotella sp. TaxID=59823 RepID=UPI003FEF84DD
MGNPKVSIILPTYNVEKYLHQCLDSIGKQTYKNIEVIIVIDGATDGSYQIAKDFCKKDARFHAYWQENAGSGPARNHGLEKATGELIMFVDPDDWCKPEYVEKMVRLQQEKDYDLVTVSETTMFYNKQDKVKKIWPPHFHEMEFMGEQQVHDNYLKLFQEGAIQAPHCRVYKASIIYSNKVVFPDLRRSQDMVFNYRYYNFCKSVLVSNYSGYMYRVLSKERAKRVKGDYYKTISLIYNDLKLLHKKWNSPFDTQLACTTMFGMVYPLLESNVMNNKSFKTMMEDCTIREIIINARPCKWHLKKVRKLVADGKFFLASLIVRLVFYMKLILL